MLLLQLVQRTSRCPATVVVLPGAFGKASVPEILV